MLTNGEERVVNGIDYVVGGLVHEPIETIQEILNDFLLHNKDLHKSLSTKLELAKNFLKVQFNRHLRTSDDNVCTHGIEFALGRAENASQEPSRNQTCPGCVYVPFVLSTIKEALLEHGKLRG